MLADEQPASEVADIIRTMIRHEDDIVNQRMTWFLTIQGLLFAALAFAWGKGTVLGIVLGVVGIAICASSYTALNVGPNAVRKLVEWWSEHKPSDYKGPDVIGDRLEWSRLARLTWPWSAIPWTFGLAWTALIALRAAGYR